MTGKTVAVVVVVVQNSVHVRIFLVVERLNITGTNFLCQNISKNMRSENCLKSITLWNINWHFFTTFVNTSEAAIEPRICLIYDNEKTQLSKYVFFDETKGRE